MFFFFFFLILSANDCNFVVGVWSFPVQKWFWHLS